MLYSLCCMSWLNNMLWPHYVKYDGFNMVNVTAIICYANATCYGMLHKIYLSYRINETGYTYMLAKICFDIISLLK